MKKILKLICFFSLCFLILRCNEVKAAQELSCIYKLDDRGYMLTQDSTGKLLLQIFDINRSFSSMNKNDPINDSGWHELQGYKLQSDETEQYDKNIKALKKCSNYLYEAVFAPNSFVLRDEKPVMGDGVLTAAYNRLPSSLGGPAGSQSNPTTSSGTTDIPTASCKNLFGKPDTPGTPAYYFVIAFKVIRFVAIILLIVLSVMDMVGAVASQDQDSVKKAGNKILKRFMLCIVIFLLPEIINFALKFFADKSIEYCEINQYTN